MSQRNLCREVSELARWMEIAHIRAKINGPGGNRQERSNAKKRQRAQYTLPIKYSLLSIADCELPIANCKLPIADCPLLLLYHVLLPFMQRGAGLEFRVNFQVVCWKAFLDPPFHFIIFLLCLGYCLNL